MKIADKALVVGLWVAVVPLMVRYIDLLWWLRR